MPLLQCSYHFLRICGCDGLPLIPPFIFAAADIIIGAPEDHIHNIGTWLHMNIENGHHHVHWRVDAILFILSGGTCERQKYSVQECGVENDWYWYKWVWWGRRGRKIRERAIESSVQNIYGFSKDTPMVKPRQVLIRLVCWNDVFYTSYHLILPTPLFMSPTTFLKTLGVRSRSPYLQPGHASLIYSSK